MTEDKVRALLVREIRKVGSQAAWAGRHGIPVTTLSDALAGRRRIGPAILDALGLEKVVHVEYRRKA